VIIMCTVWMYPQVLCLFWYVLREKVIKFSVDEHVEGVGEWMTGSIIILTNKKYYGRGQRSLSTF